MSLSIDASTTYTNLGYHPHETSPTSYPHNPYPLAGGQRSSTSSFVDHHAPSSNPRASLTAAGAPSSPNLHLNPRSCITCRRRKVKCDKRHPCSNCHKAAIECVFPGPGRAPRRNKKPPDAELLERLRRLEGVVQSLGKGTDGEDLPGHGSGDAEDGAKGGVHAGRGEGRDTPDAHRSGTEPPGLASDNASNTSGPLSPDSGRAASVSGPAERRESGKGQMEKEFGRLVVSEGRSRYVSNSFWASMTEEIAEMRDILDDPSEEEDEHATPDSDPSEIGNHQSFIFGYSSTMLSLRLIHPPVKLIMTHWEVYKQNVDPLVKILHIPTTEKLLLEAMENVNHLPRSTELVMFAIYYSAVVSLTEEECKTVLQIEREVGLRRYRFGVEQALAKTNFLGTQEISVLQAFCIFLVCVRRHDDTRFVWSLAGVAVRLATALGIHRDGEQFKLKPFDTEIRRRLWWQICSLDVRAAEDQGTDPSIMEASFDTKLPLNLNDSDIWPEMEEPPTERTGFTDMSFVLVRYEIGYTIRRIAYKAPGAVLKEQEEFITLEDQERKIEELRRYLENKYLQHCDLSVPLQWVSYNVAQLILSKMYMMLMHPLNRNSSSKMSRAQKDRLFHTSIDVVRRSRLLERQRQTFRWGWLFRTYIQWHAVAFLLAELCWRTNGPDVDLAWEAIDLVFDEWGGSVSATKKGMLWKPMRKLMIKAKETRRKELERQTMFPKDGSLGLNKDSSSRKRHSSTTSVGLQSPSTSGEQVLPGNAVTSIAPLSEYVVANMMSNNATPDAKQNIAIQKQQQQQQQSMQQSQIPQQQHQHPNPVHQIKNEALGQPHGLQTPESQPRSPLPSAIQNSHSNLAFTHVPDLQYLPPLATYNPSMSMASPPTSDMNANPAWNGMIDDPMLSQDPNAEDVMNWDGWEDMVKDFQMDVQQEPGFESGGPVLSGMGDWW
ncbi:hypothetical protein MMC25_003090 [Agyrium rufum]|nr:hypothetical protein [Agyrium rufum]